MFIFEPVHVLILNSYQLFTFNLYSHSFKAMIEVSELTYHIPLSYSLKYSEVVHDF